MIQFSFFINVIMLQFLDILMYFNTLEFPAKLFIIILELYYVIKQFQFCLFLILLFIILLLLDILLETSGVYIIITQYRPSTGARRRPAVGRPNTTQDEISKDILSFDIILLIFLSSILSDPLKSWRGILSSLVLQIGYFDVF